VLSPSLVNPGLENAGNVADIVVVIVVERARAVEFGNQGTPATIKRGSFAPAILKPTLRLRRVPRSFGPHDFSHYRGLNPSPDSIYSGEDPGAAFPGIAAKVDHRVRTRKPFDDDSIMESAARGRTSLREPGLLTCDRPMIYDRTSRRDGSAWPAAVVVVVVFHRAWNFSDDYLLQSAPFWRSAKGGTGCQSFI